MRASTLFAITLSLLLGLGAVAGARYAGLFDKKEPPPAAERPIVIKVLVSNNTLYEGIALSASMVKVRDKQLGGEEERRYKENPASFMAKFMPASPAAVSMRIPKKTIMAEQVLMADMFEDPELPPGPSDPRRVEPGYRPVNVSISKGNSVGGTIRLGDYVDVWLTSKATLGSGREAKEAIASACIARGCKVVMKRDSIWPSLKADPKGEPISFTLQANPYRAAVLEYADNRGELSLRPAPAPTTKAVGVYSDITSKEYADEDDRVRQVNQGEYTVGDPDLMRIFNLKVPAPLPPPPPPVMTRRVFGTDMYAPALYDPNGGGPLVPANSVGVPQARTAPPQAYSFGLPKGAAGGSDCESCGK